MAEPEFKVEFGAAPGLTGGVLVTLSGPVDSRSVLVFKAQIEALRRRRVRHFLLEMGEVRHINSTGLAYVITLSESMQEAGGRVALLNVQPKVKVIFESMGLLGFVSIYPSRAAAVRDLQPSPKAKPEPSPAPSAPTAGAMRRLFRRLFGLPRDRRP